MVSISGNKLLQKCTAIDPDRSVVARSVIRLSNHTKCQQKRGKVREIQRKNNMHNISIANAMIILYKQYLHYMSSIK